MKILFIITLFLVLGGKNSIADDSIVVAAFGDSLSAGYHLPAEHGFAPVLQQQLRELNVLATVQNAGVAGETSADGLLRVDWMLRKKPNIVIVEFGANDMFRGVPIATIRQNLSAIIVRIKKSGARVLLAGMQAPSNYPPLYRLRFDALYEDLADEHKVALYPFFLEGVALNPGLNLSDGLHPNAKGVRVIARNIAPLIVEMAAE